jgi:tetratricopeptide (TPR) repeat protein
VCARQALAEDSLPHLIKSIQPAVVTVIAYGETGEVLQQGSGFFIAKVGHLITNRHVLHGASRAEVKTHDGKGYPVTMVVAEDTKGDLIRVVVDIPEDAAQELHITGAVPEVGERVVVVGSPLGLEQTVSEGIVSAVRDIPGVGNLVQITAPISPGSSGSPVVNLRGEVVGIATAQMVHGQNLNFAMPGERVLGLKADKGQTLAEWTLPYFEEVLKKNPRSADAWRRVAHINFSLGRYEEAAAAFRQLTRLTPDDENAYVWLNLAYLHLHRDQEALEATKQSSRLRHKHDEEALALSKQLVRIQPSASAYNDLGQAYRRLHRDQEAVEAYKHAIRLAPNDAAAYYALGWTYMMTKRYQEAVDTYKRLLHIKPDDATAYNYLGMSYNDLGRHQEALEAFQQQVRLTPDDVSYDGLGNTYMALHRWQEAAEAYKQEAHLRPDDISVHERLGMAYCHLGDREAALQEYQIVKGASWSADELRQCIGQ